MRFSLRSQQPIANMRLTRHPVEPRDLWIQAVGNIWFHLGDVMTHNSELASLLEEIRRVNRPAMTNFPSCFEAQVNFDADEQDDRTGTDVQGDEPVGYNETPESELLANIHDMEMPAAKTLTLLSEAFSTTTNATVNQTGPESFITNEDDVSESEHSVPSIKENHRKRTKMNHNDEKETTMTKRTKNHNDVTETVIN